MLLLLLCVIVVVVNKANIIHTLVFKARPCGPIPVFDTMGFTKPKGSYCTASIISNCVKENLMSEWRWILSSLFPCNCIPNRFYCLNQNNISPFYILFWYETYTIFMYPYQFHRTATFYPFTFKYG